MGLVRAMLFGVKQALKGLSLVESREVTKRAAVAVGTRKGAGRSRGFNSLPIVLVISSREGGAHDSFGQLRARFEEHTSAQIRCGRDFHEGCLVEVPLHVGQYG